MEYNSNSVFRSIPTSGADLVDMPITHKQDWYNAEKLLISGVIDPKECDVFKKESLAYFFYGRSAYHVAQDVGARGDKVYLPVCFLLNVNAVQISKVLPFDSGAFASGYYDGFIHKKMDINNFSLAPTVEAIKGFIKFFYGDNNQYYRDNSRPINLSDYIELEMQSYINLLSNRGEESFDERYSAIEIISKVPVVLSDSIIAMIVPLDFKIRYSKELAMLETGGADIITYDTFGGSPNSYNGVIRDKLYDYLCQKGIVTKK